MNSKKEGAAIVGVGAVACAACYAGPILGFVVALGTGTLLGVALLGGLGLTVAIVGIGCLIRRHHRQAACRPAPTEVTLQLPTVRARP